MKKKNTIIIGIISIVIFIAIIAGAFILYLTDFEEPDISVRTLEVTGIDEDLSGFTLNIILDIYNPNPLSLEIIEVRGDVSIDDSLIGDIYNTTGIEIPGTTERTLDITIHIDDVDSAIISGDTLSVEGKTRAKYVGKEGESPFEESIDLEDIKPGDENLRPISVITGPHNARPLEEVVFDGSASTDRDGEVVSYSWDLGDGNTDQGSVVTHRYTTGGVYKVKLTVEDDDGASNMAIHQIVVSAL